ncbi:Uncharacterised protein [Mycobacteroides abscessus subsp. abscessus]|nr:Uncharacterised protein [Mycobacteroides abscessus subsp. abscessus]SLK35155.1 Uncharacterised protein [Mycobacteroides abscessus subsp. massiliense]
MTRSFPMPIASAAASTNGSAPEMLTPLSVRRMVNADNESCIAGYITTASVSTIVQTVSRCIDARSWAMGTASTVCARSSSNRLRANASAPAGVVRSPTPTATTPGPNSSTSPPSTGAECDS